MTEKIDVLRLDEDALRAAVLKTYQERRGDPDGKATAALAALRQLLSGAPGGEICSLSYWFEEDPLATIRSFLVDLDQVEPGLSRWALEPLLEALPRLVEEAGEGRYPNVPLFLASAAGPLALRADIDETLATGILSATALVIARVGSRTLQLALESHSGEARS